MKTGVISGVSSLLLVVGAISFHDISSFFTLKKTPYETYLRQRGDALSAEEAFRAREIYDGKEYTCVLPREKHAITVMYNPASAFQITIPAENVVTYYTADKEGIGKTYCEHDGKRCIVYAAINTVAEIFYLSEENPTPAVYTDATRQRTITTLLQELLTLDMEKMCH